MTTVFQVTITSTLDSIGKEKVTRLIEEALRENGYQPTIISAEDD